MKSSTSEPKSSHTPFCMPRPKPSSRINMKMPQNTPNAVNNVRSLFCRSVNQISWRPSSMSGGRGFESLRRLHDAVLEDDLAFGLVRHVRFVRDDDHRVA